MSVKYFMRALVPALLSILVLAGFAQDKKATEKQAADSIKQMLSDTVFTFEARTALPMKGGMRHLDPGYTLKLKGDTLISELPYYGRTYQATYGESDGGLKATSHKFDYTVKDRKKGGWDVEIDTKDTKERLKFLLTVFDNGDASLNVISNNRESINFDGYIETRK